MTKHKSSRDSININEHMLIQQARVAQMLTGLGRTEPAPGDETQPDPEPESAVYLGKGRVKLPDRDVPVLLTKKPQIDLLEYLIKHGKAKTRELEQLGLSNASATARELQELQELLGKALSAESCCCLSGRFESATS